MRVSVILSVAFSGLALAGPAHEKRQLATLQTAIQTVVTPLNSLTQSVTAFTGDAATGASLQTNNAALQTALQSATASVMGATAITAADATGLQMASGPLGAGLSGYLKAVQSKTAVLAQANAGGQVTQGLTTQRDAFVAFTNAVAGKTPGGTQAASQATAQLTAGFNTVIQGLSGGGAAAAPSSAPRL